MLAVGTARLLGSLTFDVAKDPDVFTSDEIDGNALLSKATTSADSMNVIFTIAGQVKVDDK